MQLSFLTLANFCRSSEILSSLSLVTLSSFSCHSTMLLFASSFIFNSEKDNIFSNVKATQIFKPNSSLLLILLYRFPFLCCPIHLACPRQLVNLVVKFFTLLYKTRDKQRLFLCCISCCFANWRSTNEELYQTKYWRKL